MTQTQYKARYNEFMDDPQNIRMEKDEYRPDFFEKIELVDKKIDQSINDQKEQVKEYLDQLQSLKSEVLRNIQDSHKYHKNLAEGSQESELTILLLKVVLTLTIHAVVIAPVLNAPLGLVQMLKLPKLPFSNMSLTQVVDSIPVIGDFVENGKEFTPIPSKIDPAKIVTAMERKGYRLRKGPGELNIIYVFNPDFQNTINQWSDRRMLISFKNGQPVVLHDSPATIKGGKPSWLNPPNPKGYPVTIPGQYLNSWAVGYHKGKRALQQVGPIPVMRTKDQGKTWRRDYGLFGMNQHRGAGATVKGWSEGCLVSQSGHKEFMQIIYSDPGYKQNKSFRFPTTIISMSDIK